MTQFDLFGWSKTVLISGKHFREVQTAFCSLHRLDIKVCRSDTDTRLSIELSELLSLEP